MFNTICEIQVNDSILAQKEKICYGDVLAAVEEPLRQQRFHIKDGALIWLKFSQEAERFIHCQSPRDDGFHAGYFFDLQPYEENVVFGFYQPLSKRVYVIESKYLYDAEAIVGNVYCFCANSFRKILVVR